MCLFLFCWKTYHLTLLCCAQKKLICFHPLLHRHLYSYINPLSFLLLSILSSNANNKWCWYGNGCPLSVFIDARMGSGNKFADDHPRNFFSLFHACYTLFNWTMYNTREKVTMKVFWRRLDQNSPGSIASAQIQSWVWSVLLCRILYIFVLFIYLSINLLCIY